MRNTNYHIVRESLSEYGLTECSPIFIARGGQSEIYRLSVSPHEPEIIAKVYRVNSRIAQKDRDGAFRLECKALESVAGVFDGLQCAGWQIRAPTLLHVDANRKVIFLSYERGQPLWDAIERQRKMANVFARLICDALERYWSISEEPYGDLNLKNILCDSDAGSLCFIDPGMPRLDNDCEEISRCFYPASRDIGYLLFSIAISNTRTRLLQWEKAAAHRAFARAFASCVLARYGHEYEFRRETRDCFSYYAGRRGQGIHSARTIYCSVLAFFAERLMDGWWGKRD